LIGYRELLTAASKRSRTGSAKQRAEIGMVFQRFNLFRT